MSVARTQFTKQALGTVLKFICLAGWLTFSGPACRGQETPQKQANSLMRTAQAAYKDDKYDEAAKAAIAAAALAPDKADLQQAVGEILFLCGKAEDSIPYFDKANTLMPDMAPHNWQRGVAPRLYRKFAEGADQFGSHHEVNPDDVENSAWYFLCVAKTKGRQAAEASVINSRGDRREPMMSVLKMLQERLSRTKCCSSQDKY